MKYALAFLAGALTTIGALYLYDIIYELTEKR